MAWTPIAIALAAGAMLATPTAHAATVTNGSPTLSDYRGKPVAVVFFHPL